MAVPSLLQLSRAACIQNVKRIDDYGEAPYPLVRPILLKVDNPIQLRNIEKSSPQLRGVDAELWRTLIARDVPSWRRNPIEPRDPKNWWKVYRKLVQEDKARVDEQSAILKAALNKGDAEKQKQQTVIMDKTLAPSVRRSNPGTRAPGSSASGLGSGPRNKPMTGRSILDRARREAREARVLMRKGTAGTKPEASRIMGRTANTAAPTSPERAATAGAGSTSRVTVGPSAYRPTPPTPPGPFARPATQSPRPATAHQYSNPPQHAKRGLGPNVFSPRKRLKT